MSQVTIQEIKSRLRTLYLADDRPWLVGFSGGKDSTLVAALIFEAALSVPAEQRTKEIHVVCTDTRVEIPAVVEAIETTLARMRKCAGDNDLKLEVHLLRPPAEQSFWVNIIGRGYPPPNRTFRWCTQRLKIDPSPGLSSAAWAAGEKRSCILALAALRVPHARKLWQSAKLAMALRSIQIFLVSGFRTP